MFFDPRNIATTALLILFLAIHPVAYAEVATAYADSSSESTPDDRLCTQNYHQGDAPNFTNQNLANNTHELCFDGFTVMYSSITRTPLWSAEHLTRDRLERATKLDRQNNFHEETQLPYDERATLEDYKGSGFDRGHMSPNGDMGSRKQQFNSFSLANIIPQDRYHNQNPWRLLEEVTRELVKQEGEAYVITGAAFRGSNLRKIGNVLVPSDVYKVVYFPNRKAAGVYFSPNDKSGQVNVISLAELNAQIGLDLLPSLPDSIKQQRVDMPLSTKMAIRRGDISSRPNSYSAHRNGQPMHYGVSLSSQLQPATRSLMKRMWRALASSQD